MLSGNFRRLGVTVRKNAADEARFYRNDMREFMASKGMTKEERLVSLKEINDMARWIINVYAGDAKKRV